MKKTILAAAALATLALAAPAAAHGPKRAVIYKAKLAPAAGSSVHGKALLVDGKRRDKLRLRVKGLAAGATYTWSLRKAGRHGDACSGAAVASFDYSSLEGRRSVSLRSRARGFAGGSGTYAVVISDAEGEDVACFALKTRAQRKAERKAARDDSEGELIHFEEGDEAGDDDPAGDDATGDDGEELGDDESVDDGSGDEPSDDEPAGEGEDDGLF